MLNPTNATPINVWYNDGTLEILAGETRFRVYADTLSSASSVLRDMLSDAGKPNVIQLDDSPLDLSYFLKALHTTEFFSFPVARPTLPVIAGILRLSTKYDVEYLRQYTLRHLSSIYPRFLWDVGQIPLFYSLGLDNHVIALNLAREFNIRWLRPMAMYACVLSDIPSILDSFDAHTDAENLEACLYFKCAMIKLSVDIYCSVIFNHDDQHGDMRCKTVMSNAFADRFNARGNDLLIGLDLYDDLGTCIRCSTQFVQWRIKAWNVVLGYCKEMENAEKAKREDVEKKWQEAEERQRKEESIRLEELRRILELEANRPLWEQARKEREKRVKEAEEAERAGKAAIEEAERRMHELLVQEKMKKEREEPAQRAREAKAEELRERELAKEKARQEAWEEATHAENLRCRARDARLCAGADAWDASVAVERFHILMEEYEGIKFSEAQPLTFGNIPWPVLDNPLLPSFQTEGITWDKVSTFFDHLKCTHYRNDSRNEQYLRLLTRVLLMFHPDKLRGLNTVRDPNVRESLKSSGIVVTQIVTPIRVELMKQKRGDNDGHGSSG